MSCVYGGCHNQAAKGSNYCLDHQFWIKPDRHQNELESLRADKAKLQADVSALEAQVKQLTWERDYQAGKRDKADHERYDMKLCAEKAESAFRALHREKERLREALTNLVNEASGWGAEALAEIGGWSNARALELRWNEARAALKETGNA